jgi:hypothetical protein
MEALATIGVFVAHDTWLAEKMEDIVILGYDSETFKHSKQQAST